MSEKTERKARKLEERTKANQAHAGGLPGMGGPGMVPHHNYPIPSENFHSGGRLYARPGLGPLMGQSLAMGQMGPPLQRGISNDLGPPIFMPSLNLGPKPSGNTNVTPSSLPLPNSKMKPGVMSSSATAAFMTDMLTYPAPSLSAFHSAPIKSVPYMAPPLSASSAHKAPLVPNTSIAKPTPISMGAKVPVTRVVPGGMESPQPAFSSSGASGKGPKPLASKLLSTETIGNIGVKEEGVAGQAYYPSQPPPLNSPSNSLSKMLMAPSSPAQDSEHQDLQSSADGAKVTSGGVVYSSGLATTATSGQPSSNVSFADTTRLDRPPHPSALHMPVPGGSMGVPKELGQQVKERLTTAEVASNIIISNPGLTGKHIAAMTNSTQPPSTLLPHSSYSSPIISQQQQAELLPPPGHALLNMPQHVVDTGWGFPPQYTSTNNMFHNTLSPPVSMTTGHEVPSQQSNGGGGLKSRLDTTVTSLPQSPLGGGAGCVVSSSGPSGEQNVMSSPNQLNSSPRPGILRGKRSVDGNWKLDGPPNASTHSPGSPHRTKLNLKKSSLASPSSAAGGKDTTGPPASPKGQSSEGSQSLNHMGGGNRVEDFSGSPRKKPRKQNVVANDDQYASNVPDTHHQLTQQLTGAEAVSQESKPTSSRGSCDRTTPPPSSKEVVEIRYLSQLRKSPFPINGVYKLRHHTAHNHFRRYADVKRKEALPISVYDLANDKSCQQRASGWKLFHFSSQLQELDKVEGDCLAVMEQTQSSLETLSTNPECLLDSEALRTTIELLQGNIDRCKRVQSHVDNTRTDMFTVLEDHKSQVTDVLDKYSNFKSQYSSISPSLSSASSQQKSQS